jgi:tape measure domain-containing protein
MPDSTSTERLIVDIQAKTAGFTSSINNVQKQITGLNASTNNFTKNISLGFIASKFAAFQLVSGIQQLGINIMKTTAQWESLNVAFETMIGNRTQALQLTKDMRDLAKNTPLELMDLAEGAKILLNYGFAVESIMPTLKTLGDVSLGNKEKMNRLAIALGQVNGNGRLMGQELRQMIEAGFNPLMEISDRTGESMEELRKRMSEGKISVEEITQAYADATGPGGRFYKAMEAQAKTLGGLFSNLKDSFTQLFIGIGASTVNDFGIKKMIKNLTDLVDSITATEESLQNFMIDLKSLATVGIGAGLFNIIKNNQVMIGYTKQNNVLKEQIILKKELDKSERIFNKSAGYMENRYGSNFNSIKSVGQEKLKELEIEKKIAQIKVSNPELGAIDYRKQYRDTIAKKDLKAINKTKLYDEEETSRILKKREDEYNKSMIKSSDSYWKNKYSNIDNEYNNAINSNKQINNYNKVKQEYIKANKEMGASSEQLNKIQSELPKSARTMTANLSKISTGAKAMGLAFKDAFGGIIMFAALNTIFAIGAKIVNAWQRNQPEQIAFRKQQEESKKALTENEIAIAAVNAQIDALTNNMTIAEEASKGFLAGFDEVNQIDKGDSSGLTIMKLDPKLPQDLKTLKEQLIELMKENEKLTIKLELEPPKKIHFWDLFLWNDNTDAGWKILYDSGWGAAGKWLEGFFGFIAMLILPGWDKVLADSGYSVYTAFGNYAKNIGKSISTELSKEFEHIATEWNIFWDDLFTNIQNFAGQRITNSINLLISGYNLLPFEDVQLLKYIPTPTSKDKKTGGGSSWATGGIFTKRVDNATIGENGKEVVLPLENNTQWMDGFVSKIVDAVGGNGQPIILELNGTELGRAMVGALSSYNRRTGVSIA